MLNFLPARLGGRVNDGCRGFRVLTVLAAAAIAVGCGGASNGPGSAASARSSLPTPNASVPSPSPGALPPGVLAEINLPGGPLGIGVGFGSVWVENHRGHQLYRVDPQTNKVIAQIDIGHESCGLPSFGFGRVWVNGCLGDQPAVVDAATNEVVGTLPGGVLQIGISSDSVWDADSSGVLRIDPATLKPVASIPVRGGPAYFAYGAGSVWTSNRDDGTVSRIDPSTNRVVATIPAGSAIGNSDDAFITFDFGAVWLNDSLFTDSSTIWLIDPANNTARPIKLAIPRPAIKTSNLATGQGSLWMRTFGGPVYRFDPASLALIGSFPSDPSGGFMAVGFDSIWAANPEMGTVWRIRI